MVNFMLNIAETVAIINFSLGNAIQQTGGLKGTVFNDAEKLRAIMFY